MIWYPHMRQMVLFLFLLCFLAGCETRTTIVNNVSERDANEIVVLLASKGIHAQKLAAPAATVGGTTQQTWDISVPSSKVTESLAILNQSGLPRVRGTSLLDLFGTPGLVPSDLQDRIRYQEGLSEQLAATIRKMDGVMDANVQITFPQEESGRPFTASVYVKHKGILDSSNNLLITKIKRLVASALPGLSPENVTVVADRAVYADLTIPPQEGCTLEEQGLVSIWSIVLTKNSAVRFRLIFYAFIFVIFILAALLVLVLWKFFPLIADMGTRKFFSPHQVTKESLQSSPPESGAGGSEGM